MKNNSILILAIIILNSCIKKELPIQAHTAGNAHVTQINMGQDYRKQLFYSLETNSIIQSNNKEVWDIAFESSELGWHVILNSSRKMAVHRSELEFNEIISADDLSWHWDAHSGNLDSTAIGDWTSKNYTYVLDLGYNYSGSHMGYKKIKYTNVGPTKYVIEYGDIQDISSQTMTIEKNTTRLFTYCKLGSGTLEIAPKNEYWDLEFTQYTHLFTNPDDTYLVTGVLLNRYNTSAVKIKNIPFEEIVFADVENLFFSDDISTIGYEWKWFNFTTSLYTVDPETTFIVKTNKGFMYKLHFIDFYNESGIKGYPKMEIQKL